MSMTYKLNDLTEEIFGHLCNVALHKCSDKTEKKRAGCGGRAMRKRVLIKNFVSDLFKMPKKPASSREQDMASSDEEYEDYDMTDVSFYEEEIDEFRLEELAGYEPSPLNPADCWLHQPNNVYATGGYYESSSYSSASINYQPYDMYGSSMSESATEGDMPLASDPLASLSGMESGFDPYGTSSSSSSPASNSPTSSPFYTADDFFMSNVAAEPVFVSDPYQMELTVTELLIQTAESSPVHEDTHELTDLDVATGESHANKNKRRSTELFDDFNVAFQKRIKI